MIGKDSLLTTLSKVRRFADVNSAWILSVGTVIVGSLVSLYGTEIRTNTRNFFDCILFINKHSYSINIYISLFWLIVFVWAIFLYIQLSISKKDDNEKRIDILRAIHRMPNPSVIYNYPEWYDIINTIHENKIPNNLTKKERIDFIGENLQALLFSVCKLAHDFSNKTERTRFGANIMLIAASNDFSPTIVSKLRFHEKTNLGALKAILYLPDQLIIHDHSKKQGNCIIPVISLPVPFEEQDKNGATLALPGAPTALLTGMVSVCEDTSNLYCNDFSTPIKNEIVKYFSQEGDGKNINSFVSFRIGSSDEPVGVLNIDCSEKNLLGEHVEFYSTFEALITPVISVMRGIVSEYASCIWSELESQSDKE